VTETCSTCRWWKRFPARDVYAEFEADPRPVVKTARDMLRWLWNPNQFKHEPDDIDVDFVHDPEPKYGTCHCLPKKVATCQSYICSKYQPKEGGHG